MPSGLKCKSTCILGPLLHDGDFHYDAPMPFEPEGKAKLPHLPDGNGVVGESAAQNGSGGGVPGSGGAVPGSQGVLIGDRLYSGVLIALENCLLPDDKLRFTPSMSTGLDTDSETDLRVVGCELIQAAGILLRLPQVAMATGQVLFQRFFYTKSFEKHSMEHVSMACVHLASKTEEAPRRIRAVINVFHRLRQLREKKKPVPLLLDQDYRFGAGTAASSANPVQALHRGLALDWWYTHVAQPLPTAACGSLTIVLLVNPLSCFGNCID
ncbi:hypothetical protein P7K49_000509 [Saguinus oedipus]|uniref:Cyclin-like domain-containing protein n=1 Tax=Saguinus oedipus TaxID=9490 RepID=A0ABQ9WED8_SAGOE|nr:hypothetical protein P7K49_000509 [Saguinus oedipus]